MATASIIKIGLALRYKKGSFTYSNLQPTAADSALYQLGCVINSLQIEPVESVNKIVTTRIAFV